MDETELIELLKSNLNIKISHGEGYRGEYIVVKMRYGKRVISRDSILVKPIKRF